MSAGADIYLRLARLPDVLPFENESLTLHPAYGTYEFCSFSLGAALAFGLARLFLDKLFFQPFARLLLIDKTVRATDKLSPKECSKIEKFTESLWKFLVYIALHTFAWYALFDKNWLWDTKNYWQDIPHQPHSRRVEQLYILQVGFYISSLCMLFFWETRRKDFPVMLLHHCTALTLILMSYYCGYTRVGSVILLLHDFSDILLELAKLFNYADMDRASTVAFVSMMASWFYLRLVLFPKYIIYSCSVESTRVLGRRVDYYYLFNALLLCLLMMHLYWFSLIGRVAATFVVDKKPKDVREDD